MEKFLIIFYQNRAQRIIILLYYKTYFNIILFNLNIFIVKLILYYFSVFSLNYVYRIELKYSYFQKHYMIC